MQADSLTSPDLIHLGSSDLVLSMHAAPRHDKDKPKCFMDTHPGVLQQLGPNIAAQLPFAPAKRDAVYEDAAQDLVSQLSKGLALAAAAELFNEAAASAQIKHMLASVGLGPAASLQPPPPVARSAAPGPRQTTLPQCGIARPLQAQPPQQLRQAVMQQVAHLRPALEKATRVTAPRAKSIFMLTSLPERRTTRVSRSFQG